jgi:dihydroflavonol-4-reductase
LNVEILPANILDLERLTEACTNVEVVYHLASLVAITKETFSLMQRVNVEGTHNVIEAVRRTGVRRLIYTSSIHAIQRPPEGVLIDERLAFDPHNPAGPYDQTKAEASQSILEAAREGLDVVIVCPTGVIGPFDFKRSEMGEMILAWMKKGPSFTIDGKFDFVDVRDVAQGHILAAKYGRPGQVYLLSGEQIEVSRMRQLVQKAAGLKTREVKLPAAVAAAIAPIAEVYYRFSHTKPIFTRYSVETLRSNSLISSRKAREELGYQTRPIEETIVDTVAWWQQNLDRTRITLRGET